MNYQDRSGEKAVRRAIGISAEISAGFSGDHRFDEKRDNVCVSIGRGWVYNFGF
jgi:hypothetical protein